MNIDKLMTELESGGKNWRKLIERKRGSEPAAPYFDVTDDRIVLEKDSDQRVLNRFQDVVSVESGFVIQVEKFDGDGSSGQDTGLRNRDACVLSNEVLPVAEPLPTTRLLRYGSLRNDELDGHSSSSHAPGINSVCST